MVNKWSIRREISRYPWTVLRRECKVSTGSHPHRTWGRRSRTFLASSQGRGRSTIYQLKIPGVDEVMIGRENEPSRWRLNHRGNSGRVPTHYTVHSTLYPSYPLVSHLLSALRLHLLHFIRCSLVLSGPSYRASYSTSQSIPALIVLTIN